LYKIPAKTLFIGKDLVFMPECHSTNSFALDRCQQVPQPADGTIIITDNQFAGRGQRGSTWSAAPGTNLTFSIILKPGFLAIADQFLLNVCSALAVADFLEDQGCRDVTVKWPNDVYIGAKKVCGILVESQIRGNHLLWSVIGIGLNINQANFGTTSATSLSLESGKSYKLDDCLSKLVTYVEARYLQARQTIKDKMVGEYESRLYWVNALHQFESPERGLFEGWIVGIDALGRLRISIDEEETSFGMKELVFIK
jgi:BirA family transcriptional regulator, biotin operon repressor / biotin---[acetyl-CoA-carboxylase] ligase